MVDAFPYLERVLLTAEEAAGHWPGNLVCEHPCCNLHIWLAQHRRPEGRPSQEDSKSHHLKLLL